MSFLLLSYFFFLFFLFFFFFFFFFFSFFLSSGQQMFYFSLKSLSLKNVRSCLFSALETSLERYIPPFHFIALSMKCEKDGTVLGLTAARFDKIFNNINFPDKGLKQNTILFILVQILFEHVWLVRMISLQAFFLLCIY